ncbi:hypothetical protein C8J57DRAFT_1226998 [Mycena rebaudengoi]|nr:hypothetical protein C8J57DRAFT_1226998 [Mycena rebaudengoi]
MNYAPFAGGGVREVVQISSLMEPSLEVIQVNPCGIGKQLRILGPKFCGERLWNISLHPMEGQGTCCITKLLQNRVREACQKRCELCNCTTMWWREYGKKESAGYRINNVLDFLIFDRHIMWKWEVGAGGQDRFVDVRLANNIHEREISNEEVGG